MSGMKMIRVEIGSGPKPHNVGYLNPAFISMIKERHGESGLSGVDITIPGDHGIVTLTPEEWRDCTLVDLEEALPCPQGEPGPDESADPRNVIPDASGCRIALSAILTACDIGGLPTDLPGPDDPLRSVIESHRRVLSIIKERAEEAYRHAGGKQ